MFKINLPFFKTYKVIQKLYMMCICFLCTQRVFAAKISEGEEHKIWQGLYDLILGFFTGPPALIISLIALLVGAWGGLFSQQHKIAFAGSGIAIPIIIHFGPGIFMSLSGAVV